MRAKGATARKSDVDHEALAGLNFDFSQSPTVWSFLHDDSFFRGLLGPVGCVGAETLVITEYGPMPIAHIDRPMRVLSWNDKTCRFQLSWCGGAFPKGTDYLYRVTTRSGEFAASGHHLTYVAGRDYQHVQDLKAGDVLLAASPYQLGRVLSGAHVESPQDALHSTRTAVDSLGHYAASARRYGRRLLTEVDIDLSVVLKRVGARKSVSSHDLSCAVRMDDRWARLLGHIRQGLHDARTQIDDFLGHVLRLLVDEANPNVVPLYAHAEHSTRVQPRSPWMIENRRRVQLSGEYSHSSEASSISDRTIIGIEREEVKRAYWDMQVLDTHNYVTFDGTIHHNSGKSYACAAEVILRAVKQPPSPIDNIRYSRFVVVRNSYPELRTTTIKTWTEIFPENVWGPMRWSPPITHHLKLPPRDGIPGLDAEVIFLALDQPKDVRKLLSLELTGAWVNEARELPLAVIQGLTHRVGRYPTKANGGAPWRGIWADTNPMDSDHWWFRLSEKETIKGKFKWTFFKQPPGMIEALSDDEDAILGAGKYWRINPNAENINNLPVGYYDQQLGGKNLDWIKCYVAGEYVYVQEGKPVWPEYSDSQMNVDKIDYAPDLPLHIGIDFGLTPAAVFGQRTRSGRWNIIHEIVAFDMGLERFGHMLIGDIHQKFPKAQIFIWGDPAGMARDGIFEVTAFQHLKSLGLNAQPTQSNDFMVRREAGAAPMQRLIDGKPGLLVDSSCVRVRKSLGGGYHFKRIGVGGGTDRFRDAPNKNEHSHVGDAYGYLMLGGGEYRVLTRGQSAHHPQRTHVAPMDFNVF